MEQLIIIGASGHGKVVADIAVLNGYRDIIFLDDNRSLRKCGKYDVSGLTSKAVGMSGDIIVGIGDNMMRKHFCEQYIDRLTTLIHPNAVIADGVEIGVGSVIMAGTVINSGSRIGMGNIVNTSSSVDHDCKVGKFVHIAVASHLCGNVKIGDHTWIGAGAVIINNMSIYENCVIGAGAVVIKDLKEPGTYVGVPARKMNNLPAGTN